MKTFSIVVCGAPYSSQAASTALKFSEAALEAGHNIYRLFFYADGVHNASAFCIPPQDEKHIPEAWQMLIRQHDLDAVVCVASALKRGILDEGEAQRYEKGQANLLPAFTIGGLGQLIDASINSDRLVSFKP
jgi:tRNA 2-thiouridine synthesizing protein D